MPRDSQRDAGATRGRGRSETKVQFYRRARPYLLFILCRLKGECSVPALPGFFLERCLGVLAAVILVVLCAFVGCEFVLCGAFLPVPALLVPERADTTVPTAVPTFWATSVKTPGSAALDSLLVSLRLFVLIRYPPQTEQFDAPSVCQVARRSLERLKPA